MQKSLLLCTDGSKTNPKTRGYELSQIPEITDNSERNRFELQTDGKTAFIDYIINKKGVIFLTHTEVPVGLEGKGIASEMVLRALKIIEQRKLKLVPICPFVTSYVMRHPEWKKLLDEYHRM